MRGNRGGWEPLGTMPVLLPSPKPSTRISSEHDRTYRKRTRIGAQRILSIHARQHCNTLLTATPRPRIDKSCAKMAENSLYLTCPEFFRISAVKCATGTQCTWCKTVSSHTLLASLVFNYRCFLVVFKMPNLPIQNRTTVGNPEGGKLRKFSQLLQ